MNDTLTHWQRPHVAPVCCIGSVSLPRAMWRGIRGRCPGCGTGRLFGGFLRLQGPCETCGAPTDRVHTDDVAPYFTTLVAGHVIVGSMVATEAAFSPGMLTEALLWIPLATGATVGLLRPVKGAVAAVMLKLDMLAGPETSQQPSADLP